MRDLIIQAFHIKDLGNWIVGYKMTVTDTNAATEVLAPSVHAGVN